MNKLSELRQRIRNNGSAVIAPEEYDKLQEEWITRCLDGQTELAELERLRVELANLKQSLALEGKAHEETWQRMAKRTDELAAAKALLREALKWPVPISWSADVRAALGDEE